MRNEKILVIAIISIVAILFAFFYGPYVWVSVYSKFFGQRDIVNTTREIASNATDPVVVLNRIANWLNANITYDAHAVYSYPISPFILFRKVPADPAWTMTVRRGACEEEAVLFTEMARLTGIEARTVYNPAEDHVWCEVLINGSWTPFDPGLPEDERLNNPGFYERPEPNGWGKELSYVYFSGPDGKENDVTKTYTGTGRLIVKVEKDGQPVQDARVLVESRFLMENYPSSYGQPQFCLENHTDNKGSCIFDLGGNNYTVVAELGTFFGYRNQINTSLKENSEISVTLTLSDFSLLVPVGDILTILAIIIILAVLVIGAVLTYRNLKTSKKRSGKNHACNAQNEVTRAPSAPATRARHDVNNKLTAVTGNVYLARKKLSGNSEVLGYLRQIEASVEQTAGIFDFAKTYEMLGVEELVYVDVGKTVDEAVSLFPTLKGIKVMNDCHGLTVLADSLLRQLFYNLIDNSLKYGEKLSWIRVHYEEKNGGHLNVIYEDNGIGISPNAKPKLFNQGYTIGKGSGYGLYLIKKMMEVYGWAIEETGEPGKGAKFVVTMPETNSNGKESYVVGR